VIAANIENRQIACHIRRGNDLRTSSMFLHSASTAVSNHTCNADLHRRISRSFEEARLPMAFTVQS